MISLTPNGGSESSNTFPMHISYVATNLGLSRVAFSSPIKISLTLALRQKGPATSLSLIYDLGFKSRDGAFRVCEIFQQSIETFMENHLQIQLLVPEDSIVPLFLDPLVHMR